MPIIILIVHRSVVIPKSGKLARMLIRELVAMTPGDEASAADGVAGSEQSLRLGVAFANLTVWGTEDCCADGRAVVHVDSGEPEGVGAGYGAHG